MLVLTRKEGESIVVLGEGEKPICRIVVVKMQGGKVKIGVEAEGNLDILREELWDDEPDRKSTRLNSSHVSESRMPSSA